MRVTKSSDVSIQPWVTTQTRKKVCWGACREWEREIEMWTGANKWSQEVSEKDGDMEKEGRQKQKKEERKPTVR